MTEQEVVSGWTAEDLTADWVTDQLRKAGVLRAVRVVSLDVTDLDRPGLTGDLRRRLGYDVPRTGRRCL